MGFYDKKLEVLFGYFQDTDKLRGSVFDAGHSTLVIDGIFTEDLLTTINKDPRDLREDEGHYIDSTSPLMEMRTSGFISDIYRQTQESQMDYNNSLAPWSIQQTFGCDLCPYKSSRAYNLSRHKSSIHNIGVQYHCPICSSSFGDKYRLREHMCRHGRHQMRQDLILNLPGFVESE